MLASFLLHSVHSKYTSVYVLPLNADKKCHVRSAVVFGPRRCSSRKFRELCEQPNTQHTTQPKKTDARYVIVVIVVVVTSLCACQRHDCTRYKICLPARTLAHKAANRPPFALLRVSHLGGTWRSTPLTADSPNGQSKC